MLLFEPEEQDVTDLIPSHYINIHMQRYISVDFVCGQIKDKKCGKAMGLDNVRSKLLKDSPSIIAKPLLML